MVFFCNYTACLKLSYVYQVYYQYCLSHWLPQIRQQNFGTERTRPPKLAK